MNDIISILIGVGVMVIYFAILEKMGREIKDVNKPHNDISR